MPRVVDWLDRGLIAFVSRVSGRTVAIVSLGFYPGLGLALPLAFDWTLGWFVYANLMGVLLAGATSLGWLAVKIEQKDRRHLLEWTTELRYLTAQEFEWLVGEMLRREGWTVRETGSQDGPDGNVDLVLTKGNDRRLVQCKRWESFPVGVKEIRGFAGTLLRENLRGKEGIFVTLSRFNEHAMAEAKENGIELIDGGELFRRVERARRPEPCPTCQRPMALDRSKHGWWFRCVASSCSGKRDLDRDPARAVELLTQRPGITATPAGADQ